MSLPVPDGAATGVEGTGDSAELADVFRVHLEAYRRAHCLTDVQAKAARAIQDCRTAVLGGHREWCDACGYERYVHNSCGNRHCPKCQALSRVRWLEERKRELLPVPYFHTVFTLPHELNALILWSAQNQRALLNLLFEAAAQTLLQFGRSHLGGRPGFMLVLHTWDQQLRPHYHVHGVIAGGALADDGGSFTRSRPRFLFPVKAMSRVYREKYLEGVVRLLEEQKLKLQPQMEKLSMAAGRADWLRRLRQKSWVVYSKPPFAGPEQVLSYLGRYTHRVAISNRRILQVDAEEVRFSYRDRRDGDRQKVGRVSGEEFIRRFLTHILPDGFMRIRHYGFLANRGKKENLARCRELLEVDTPPASENSTPAQRILEGTAADISSCPHCGSALHREEITPLALRRPLPPREDGLGRGGGRARAAPDSS